MSIAAGVASRDRHRRASDLRDFLRTIQKPDCRIETIADDTSLIEAGLIDSLAVLEIVAYLEQTYGLDFGDTGIDPGDLTSIAGILDMVERTTPSDR